MGEENNKDWSSITVFIILVEMLFLVVFNLSGYTFNCVLTQILNLGLPKLSSKKLAVLIFIQQKILGNIFSQKC